MVGKYLTIDSMNFMINWTNNNWMPSIKTWLWNNLVVLSLTLNFKNAGFRKNWKKTADKQRYEATLKQTRTLSHGDNIGKEITNALAR